MPANKNIGASSARAPDEINMIANAINATKAMPIISNLDKPRKIPKIASKLLKITKPRTTPKAT